MLCRSARRLADRHNIGGQFLQHVADVVKHAGNRMFVGQRLRAVEIRVHDPDNLRSGLRQPSRDMRRVSNHAAADHGDSEFTL